MALATGLASFCFDLPLTVRSTFYPIFGEYVWGWLGDLLDSWSIVMSKQKFIFLGTIPVFTCNSKYYCIFYHFSCGRHLHLTWTRDNADDDRTATFGLD